MIYGWEKLKRCLAEPNLADMIAAHFEEAAAFKGVPLKLDWETRLRAEEQGQFRVFTVREGKTLVGYVEVWFTPHDLHVGTAFARLGHYYLDPSYRRSGAGLEMFRRVLATPEVGAVEIVTLTEPLHYNRSLGRFFERLGFAPLELIHAKRMR